MLNALIQHEELFLIKQVPNFKMISSYKTWSELSKSKWKAENQFYAGVSH